MYRFILIGVVGCATFILVRKTKHFWVRLLFPLGYYLYTTRLGYHLHLWQLSRKRHSAHSITQPLSLSGFTIIPLAILSDNYCYIVVDDATKTAVAVDPADPEAVKTCVKERGLSLKALLTTHKHWDHSGGNEVLMEGFRDVVVYGGARDYVPGATHPVEDQETIKIGRLEFRAIWTPGHTKGHIVYVLQSNPQCAFTGDHLFVGGTGMIFEHEADIMLHSIKKITELPGNTLLFPGHEYTWANIKFIDSLYSDENLPTPNSERSNIDIRNKLHWVTQQRQRRIATIPAVLSEELRYSPYLQTSRVEVKGLVGLSYQASEDKVLAELRRRKNMYKPI